ncbi:MAG: hypothetical protein KF884_05735 [Fimbriimonadaceae bacterium]|nr:hypothetical protein [Fimbriimonadaceae bacterium]QYK59586.1 MAG: hypothetical protein KF884_05735 [Fimbriimonadaceae bacterium]
MWLAFVGLTGGGYAQVSVPTDGAIREVVVLPVAANVQNYQTFRRGFGPGNTPSLGYGLVRTDGTARAGTLRVTGTYPNWTLAFDTDLPLPTGSTLATAIDMANGRFGGYANGGGASDPVSTFWPNSTSFTRQQSPRFGRIQRLNPTGQGGGYWINLQNEIIPLFVEVDGTERVVARASDSQAEVQAVDPTGLYIAGWHGPTSQNGGPVHFWSRGSDVDNFNTRVQVTTSNGIALAVNSAGSVSEVIGYLTGDGRLFFWTQLTNPPTLTLLSQGGEVVSPVQTVRTENGEASYTVGNRGTEPYVFVQNWFGQGANRTVTGVANDLRAFLAPGSPIVQGPTYVTGIDQSGQLGGIDIGIAGSKNYWMTASSFQWIFSSVEAVNLADAVNGHPATWPVAPDWASVPDGLALRYLPKPSPVPVSPKVVVDFLNLFTPTSPTNEVVFRTTLRVNVSGWKLRVSFKNWSTGQFELPSNWVAPNLGSIMQTFDVALAPSQLPTYLNQSGEMEARVETFQVIAGSSAPPAVDIEQARFISRKP